MRDLLLVHGAGLPGAAAWRQPWAADGRALDLMGTRDVRERAELVAVATTVVTGAWNAEYDAIADALVDVGAARVVLRGADHRPHDLPAFADVLARLDG